MPYKGFDILFVGCEIYQQNLKNKIIYFKIR